MKINCQLDYQSLLNTHTGPLHLALTLTAAKSHSSRTNPLAFCVVLDRSQSMSGKPLEYARQACELAVRNLRPEDYFSLVIFDHEAQVLVPLQQVRNKQSVVQIIRQVVDRGSTNLTAGWMLGRDELRRVSSALPRRMLLLTDGHLNVGIVEPGQVNRIVSTGVEQEGIRTSCVGFGNGYSEDLLRQLAKTSGGDFYDAESPEKLPVIFREELNGLQQLTAQNVRLRVRRLELCQAWTQYSDYSTVNLPDGRVELALGDLVSEEERTLVLNLALNSPLLAETNRLVEVELLWEEVSPGTNVSRRHTEIIHAELSNRVVLSPVVAWVALQKAAKVIDEVTAEMDAHRSSAARAKLEEAMLELQAYEMPSVTQEGMRLLHECLNRVNAGLFSARDRKLAQYTASFYRKGSSEKSWTGNGAAPVFSRKVSAGDQVKQQRGMVSRRME